MPSYRPMPEEAALPVLLVLMLALPAMISTVPLSWREALALAAALSLPSAPPPPPPDRTPISRSPLKCGSSTVARLSGLERRSNERSTTLARRVRLPGVTT